MNGSTHQCQIEVFDKIVIERDLSNSVTRTYSIVNRLEEPLEITYSHIEKFELPIHDFQCISKFENVDILPLEEPEVSELRWVLNASTIAPGDSIKCIEFSFKRASFLHGSNPLRGEHKFNTRVAVNYSAEIIPAISCFFTHAEVDISPLPTPSDRDSFKVTNSGQLIVASRLLTNNPARQLCLKIETRPQGNKVDGLLSILTKQVSPKVSFDELTLIIVPHLLRDFVPFIEALEAAGAKPDKTFIVGIPYSFKEEAHLYLLHKGYKNIWIPEDYPFSREIREVIEAASLKREGTNSKILIIEDGGYIVPAIHRSFPDLIEHVIGAVEQTANGIWAYKEIPENERKIATINVAESDLKKRRESPLIGQAVFMNISKLLEKVRVGIRDKRVLVVGYGATGSEVAKSFKGNGAIVSVFDSLPERLEAAKQDGFNISQDLEVDMSNQFLVIGCTGKESLHIEHLLRANYGLYIVNASSKRLEIDYSDLSSITQSTENIPGFGTIYHLINGRKITLLANGFPVNFFNAESVPDYEIEFIYGLLFMSAVHLISEDNLIPGILEVPNSIQNDIEKTHNALLGIASSAKPS